MSSAKRRPFCLGINLLKDHEIPTFTDVKSAHDNYNSEGHGGNEGTCRLQFPRQLHIYTVYEGHDPCSMIWYWFRIITFCEYQFVFLLNKMSSQHEGNAQVSTLSWYKLIISELVPQEQIPVRKESKCIITTN